MRYQPGSRIDRYEVLEALGKGAYAETYKARDTATGDTVVLKSPDPMLFADPGLFQRFRRETEIARRLHHPGVQRSVDLAEKRSEPYLVLEYVDGDSLRQRLRQYEGPVPIDQALDWGRQLAEALAYLHANGIVHRDLKPENILVTADGRLKVADFGTAMLTGARRLTWRHLSESLGTPDYMSPEQVQGNRGDARSDIYSWGVIMYELLTGRVPFGGDNWLAVMAGHLQSTPTRILKLRPDVSPALDAVVLHAMRRHPENRYASAEEIVADLDHLDSLDPTAYDLSPEPPIGGLAAAADSARRLWILVAGIALGFLALVAAIIGLTVVLR
ncbi:MAG: serine/threonine protein kinase [Actinobacteria bacterium]|nr:MAG: serine/threonine protein kinase [Actinomycetota bacterium]